MFTKILIANRGEIALRVARTCRELGIRTVVAHSAADRDSPAVAYADEAVQIGPAAPKRSYLNAAAVVQAAMQTGAQAIHPGYGFLSEDPDFAEICAASGLTFIGPPAEVIEQLGDKARARKVAEAAGLPVLPGSSGPVASAQEARLVAAETGYPVLLKAVAGGGGRGMVLVTDPAELDSAYASTHASAQAIFGDPRLYVEKFLTRTRHVEVQVLADNHGNVLHLGARDCSVQRRRQKLVEETPPPGLPAGTIQRMGAASARAAAHVGYAGAGTYEFLVDADGDFYFIEANCRIQVEHPVTEMVTGLDLVREQIMVAAGRPLSVRQDDVASRGVAIECRVNAEDPDRGFVPAPGVLADFIIPCGPFTRVDAHGRPGLAVAPYYDSLLAKVVVWAPDRAQAIERMLRALGEFTITGDQVITTTGFLRRVIGHPAFRAGLHTTDFIDQFLASEAVSPRA